MNAPARGGRVEVVYLVAAAACWGIGTVISKQAVAELPPLTLLVMQLASSVVFLAVLGRAGAPNTSPRTAERRILARLDEPVQAVHNKQLGHLGIDRLWALTELLGAARAKTS